MLNCRSHSFTSACNPKNNSAVNPAYNVDEIRKQFSNNKKSHKESPELIEKCKFCSFSHKRGSCPAYGKLCKML